MVSRTLLRMDNRYPTPKERSDLQAYIATTRARRAALEDVRRATGKIVDDTIAGMRRMYPQFSQHRPQGFDKTKRDMGLVTGLAANAMFLGETETVDDMFTVWFMTIMKGVHLTPQVLSDTFELWVSAIEANVAPESFSLIRPFAEHMAKVISDVPVPATDEVGERSQLV